MDVLQDVFDFQRCSRLAAISVAVTLEAVQPMVGVDEEHLINLWYLEVLLHGLLERPPPKLSQIVVALLVDNPVKVTLPWVHRIVTILSLLKQLREVMRLAHVEVEIEISSLVAEDVRTGLLPKLDMFFGSGIILSVTVVEDDVG